MSLPKKRADLAEKVRRISGYNPYLCMQCGVCSASCSGRRFMDYYPRQVLCMIQAGNAEVLNCKSLWTCCSCLICTARCPRGLDVARIMESLRAINQRQGKGVINAEEIGADLLKNLPLMAVTSGFRKLSTT